jgi:hypothetical protein
MGGTPSAVPGKIFWARKIFPAVPRRRHLGRLPDCRFACLAEDAVRGLQEIHGAIFRAASPRGTPLAPCL